MRVPSGNAATPETIQLRGGTLALDFANSVDYDEHGHFVAPASTDVLTAPELLARWGERLGIVSAAVRITGGDLQAARELRAALHVVFSAVARDAEPPRRELAAIAESYAAATAAGRLAPGGDGAWRLQWPTGEPRAIRFAVAADAVRLLGDPARLARVTRCPGRDCGWLFLNASGRRRWCSMGACGSREKMRRMYARRHP